MSEDTIAEVEAPAPIAKYTDADLQRAVQTRLAKEAKKYESQLSELQSKATQAEEMSARLAQLEEERESVGKTAIEKEASRYKRELDKLQRELEARTKLVSERDTAYQQVQTTLRTERAMRQVMDTLASEKALNAARAAKYAMTDIVIEHGEDGSLLASYGDQHDVTLGEAVKAWLKDNDNFLPAPAGGAGTRAGGSIGAQPLHERSASDLMKLARKR